MKQERMQTEVTLATGATLAFAVIVLILSMALVCTGNALDVSRQAQFALTDYTATLERENAGLRKQLDELESAAVTEPQSYTTEREGEDAAAEPERIYAGSYYITGYDVCVKCCGKTDGITASGAVAQVGRTVASNAFPFGTELYIDGIGTRIVEDRGPSRMPDYTIDVLCEDHPTCYALTGWYDVYVISEGE